MNRKQMIQALKDNSIEKNAYNTVYELRVDDFGRSSYVAIGKSRACSDDDLARALESGGIIK